MILNMVIKERTILTNLDFGAELSFPHQSQKKKSVLKKYLKEVFGLLSKSLRWETKILIISVVINIVLLLVF